MTVAMEEKAPTFELLRGRLDEIQSALREAGLDGWLLYDVYARNKVAMGMLGFGEQKRRYFAWIPATGEPVAVMHGSRRARGRSGHGRSAGTWRGGSWTRSWPSSSAMPAGSRWRSHPATPCRRST